MATTRIHTTVTGHRIEYERPPKVDAFLRRLEEMVEDPKLTEQDLIGFAYSKENPILDDTMFPTRGAVTKEVLADPVYGVVTDLLFRKRIAQDDVDVEKLASRYSMTVGEAAAELGVHESAIRQAIAAKRLASWVKDGKHFLDPRSMRSFELERRGPKPKLVSQGEPLQVRVGNDEGVSFSIKSPTPIVGDPPKRGSHSRDGEIATWKRIVVRSVMNGEKRAWVLTPAVRVSDITVGDFYIKGRFTIAEQGTSKKAESLWRDTQPE